MKWNSESAQKVRTLKYHQYWGVGKATWLLCMKKKAFKSKKKCLHVGNKHSYAEKWKKTSFDQLNVFNARQESRMPLLEKQTFRAGWLRPVFSLNHCRERRKDFLLNNRCYFLFRIWIRSQAKGIFLIRKITLVALLASILYFGGSPSGSIDNTKA